MREYVEGDSPRELARGRELDRLVAGVRAALRAFPGVPQVACFVEHVVRELAGMAAALRGLDALVFTGGIGENATALRERIIREAAWLGPIDVRVVRTDEESVIARHTATLLQR